MGLWIEGEQVWAKLGKCLNPPNFFPAKSHPAMDIPARRERERMSGLLRLRETQVSPFLPDAELLQLAVGG